MNNVQDTISRVRCQVGVGIRELRGAISILSGTEDRTPSNSIKCSYFLIENSLKQFFL
jgi:hypothetical protein